MTSLFLFPKTNPLPTHPRVRNFVWDFKASVNPSSPSSPMGFELKLMVMEGERKTLKLSFGPSLLSTTWRILGILSRFQLIFLFITSTPLWITTQPLSINNEMVFMEYFPCTVLRRTWCKENLLFFEGFFLSLIQYGARPGTDDVTFIKLYFPWVVWSIS